MCIKARTHYACECDIESSEPEPCIPAKIRGWYCWPRFQLLTVDWYQWPCFDCRDLGFDQDEETFREWTARSLASRRQALRIQENCCWKLHEQMTKMLAMDAKTLRLFLEDCERELKVARIARALARAAAQAAAQVAAERLKAQPVVTKDEMTVEKEKKINRFSKQTPRSIAYKSKQMKVNPLIGIN
jgi:hypothetical protein